MSIKERWYAEKITVKEVKEQMSRHRHKQLTEN